MDQFAGWRHAITSRANLGEAATNCQSKIARGCNLPHERGRGRTKTAPQPKRMRLVENSLARDGGGYRSIESFGQRHEVGTRLESSESDVKQRPAAGFDPLAGLLELLHLRRWSQPCRLRIACSQNVTMQISLTTSSLMTKKIVLCGNFDERWPGGSAASNLASAADGRVDFRSTLRTQLSLGHGSRDRELIDIVELERFSRVAPNSASQHQHGDAIEISFGNA